MIVDRDTVLAVTGDRTLTRFHRAGTHQRIELPFAPLAIQIATQIFAVDARGATHRFALDGAFESVVPVLADVEPRAAAVSRDGNHLAILTDRIRLFELGVEEPRTFGHRTGDWREHGVGLSDDGTCLLVHYDHHDTHGLALGDRAEVFEIVRRRGPRPITYYRLMQRSLHGLVVAMSEDARRIAYHLEDQYVHVAEGVSMTRLHLVEPAGRVHAMRWFDERLAILFDYELVIVDERVQRIPLPEHFEDVVLLDGEAVCMHPELGAWWVTTTAAAAT